MTLPCPRTDAAPLRAPRLLLGLLMALALGLFVAQSAPELAQPGTQHRAWLTVTSGGAAGLHQRETALRQGLAPQPQPLAVPPQQGEPPKGSDRWSRAEAVSLAAGAALRHLTHARARAPPFPVL